MYAHYVQFNKDNYVFNDEDSQAPLNDSNHLHLFNFLSYDLSNIEKLTNCFLTEQFCFKRMRLKENRPAIKYNSDYEKALHTIDIINLSDYAVPNAYIQSIISILISSHPFYSMGFQAEKGAESIIVDGFNIKSCASEYVMDKKEYDTILNELLTVPPFLHTDFRKSFFGESKINTEIYYKNYVENYDKYRALR